MRLLLIFFALSTAFAQNIVLKPGLYEVVSGNNDSICPQQIKTFVWDDIMTGIKTVFVGDCYYWGPFEVGCDSESNICESPGLFEYQILNEESFIWTNTQYDIYGTFKLNK